MDFHPDRIGDIRIPKYRVNIEVEHTQKTMKRYKLKLSASEDGFAQVWILKDFRALKSKLNQYCRLVVKDKFAQAILESEMENCKGTSTEKDERTLEVICIR